MAVDGHKWTQHPLTMSGVLSPLLAVGGPQLDSGPFYLDHSRLWRDISGLNTF